MHSELKQYLRLMTIIVLVMVIASLGLFVESLNGLAWLLATPVVVGAFLWYRRWFRDGIQEQKK